MVFAREITDPLTGLVKKIDAATAKSDKKMGSFVVLLSDKEDAEKQLKELAKKEKIDHTTLSLVDKPDGPPGYHIAKDADITVLLYVDKKVQVNHAFKKGEFTDKDVEQIVGEFAKMKKD